MDTSWDEVERMAQAASAADAQIASQYPDPDTINRWKRLFGYSSMEAVRLISNQRSDLLRERITDDHWALIKNEKEAIGYDREAYEHSLQLLKLFKSQSASISATGANGEMMLLFRLGGQLDTPEKVKRIAELTYLPVVGYALGETGTVEFCVVDKDAAKKLETWLTQQAVLQQ